MLLKGISIALLAVLPVLLHSESISVQARVLVPESTTANNNNTSVATKSDAYTGNRPVLRKLADKAHISIDENSRGNYTRFLSSQKQNIVQAFGREAGNKRVYIECMPTDHFRAVVQPVHRALTSGKNATTERQSRVLVPFKTVVISDDTCTLTRISRGTRTLSKVAADLHKAAELDYDKVWDYMVLMLRAMQTFHDSGFALVDMRIDDFVLENSKTSKPMVALVHYTSAVRRKADRNEATYLRVLQEYETPRTFRYTPPEWYTATSNSSQLSGTKTNRESPILDDLCAANRWSVGVIAMELILGRQAVPKSFGKLVAKRYDATKANAEPIHYAILNIPGIKSPAILNQVIHTLLARYPADRTFESVFKSDESMKHPPPQTTLLTVSPLPQH